MALDGLKGLPIFGQDKFHFPKRGHPYRTILIKISHRSLIESPFPVHPLCIPSINPLNTSKMVVEMIKGEAVQNLSFWIDKLNVKDMMITPVPNLVVFEETRGLLSPHLNGQEITDSLVGKRDEVFVAQKGEESDEKCNKEQRECDSVEAHPACFHSGDLTMPGKHAKSEKGGQQHCIGKGPLKSHFWNLVEKVLEYEMERSPMFDEEIHLLEKEDDDIDKDQTAKGQA